MYALIFAGPVLFLSTLSLRRATRFRASLSAVDTISIHALLAESDPVCELRVTSSTHFYPRSPCGERPWAVFLNCNYPLISIHALLAESDTSVARTPTTVVTISIHALLAESDSPCCGWFEVIHYFYPRSPCGERRESQQPCARPTTNFYPRSPCGERLNSRADNIKRDKISIHALLAESDSSKTDDRHKTAISIHALLAESDPGRI